MGLTARQAARSLDAAAHWHRSPDASGRLPRPPCRTGTTRDRGPAPPGTADERNGRSRRTPDVTTGTDDPPGVRTRCHIARILPSTAQHVPEQTETGMTGRTPAAQRLPTLLSTKLGRTKDGTTAAMLPTVRFRHGTPARLTAVPVSFHTNNGHLGVGTPLGQRTRPHRCHRLRGAERPGTAMLRHVRGDLGHTVQQGLVVARSPLTRLADRVEVIPTRRMGCPAGTAQDHHRNDTASPPSQQSRLRSGQFSGSN